jgi:hypothetical protein
MNVDEILIWREWLRLHHAEYDVLPADWIAYRRARSWALWVQIGGAPAGAIPDTFMPSDRQPQPGDVFDYNVRLGQGSDPGPGFDVMTRLRAVLATQFRLDAVGFTGETPTIFEIKRDVGAAQLGQILSYDAIWRSQKVTPIEPKLRLVGADFKPNVLVAIRENGIQFDTVPVDFRVLSPYNTTPLASV